MNKTILTEEGIAHSSLSKCDTIYVMHTLFPDAMTRVKDITDDKDNYFELTLNPSLSAVSFKGIIPLINNDSIIVEMPYLFESKEAVFIKKAPGK